MRSSWSAARLTGPGVKVQGLGILGLGFRDEGLGFRV